MGGGHSNHAEKSKQTLHPSSTCEKHFAPDDIEICKYNSTTVVFVVVSVVSVVSAKMTKKRPKFGVLPTLNMPQKSHQSEKPAPRRPSYIDR